MSLHDMLPVDPDRFHSAAVRRNGSLMEIAERELVTFNSLDQHVVVFTRGVITPTGLRFSANCFRKIIEGSGVRTGAKKRDLFIGPFGSNLVPMRDLSLRVRFPNLLQLRDGH